MFKIKTIPRYNPVRTVPNKAVMHAALSILSRRQVSTGQMQFMLSKKGHTIDGVKACIERLKQWGYLNDEALAKSILGAMIRNTPCGRRRCFHELKKRRFDKGLAEALIEETYSEFDESELAQIAARQYAKNKTKWTQKDKGRLARWLFRRGFTQATILSLLKTLGQADDCG